jgi:hypothetical protein
MSIYTAAGRNQSFKPPSARAQRKFKLLANVRNPDVAGVHNENDFNMLTRVAEITGNMSSYPVGESPPC